MSITELWSSSIEAFKDKKIGQIVSILGDGSLRDNNNTSLELRQLLSSIPTAQVGRYIDECLEKSFPDSGLVLQDLVNELGSRLDCNVESGLYRGKPKDIGFDGIWKYPNGYSIVVEVKTTDAYAINIDTIARYRRALIEAKRISSESAILIVVGRNDSGGLEAQVRGSRHAWDVRIISAEALLKLVLTKEDTDNQTTIDKIRSLLVPKELTKLDFIVDLLAITADDIKRDVEDDSGADEVSTGGHASSELAHGKRFTPVAFNAEIASVVGKHLGATYKKKTRSLYESLDHKSGIYCLASKTYDHPDKEFFWYAFHPHQKLALEKYQDAYIAFGCGNPETVLLFPMDWFIANLDSMNITENEKRMYWHVQFYRTKTGSFFTNFRADTETQEVTKFLVKKED